MKKSIHQTLSSTSRRKFLAQGGALGAAALLPWSSAFGAITAVEIPKTRPERSFDLTIANTKVNITGREADAITLNGTMPGPLLRFMEGDEVTVRVTNRLAETTAIHWHGLLIPNSQDGVPGVTFPGIRPGETFTYQYKLRQSGTYWYHSHAGLQEAAGMFAPLIIEPKTPDPFKFDRDYVVMLSDWNDDPPPKVLANLKKLDGYYNYRRVTTPEFLKKLAAAPDEKARKAIWAERMEWAKMRMDPTDYSDGGDEWSFLMSGQRPGQNWTALFKPGERVRLRVINASPMNLYDFRIPGLPMTIVQADGQNIQPVVVDEFRIGNGETYDVIIEPKEDRAYTIFAPTIARIGYSRGTLAPRPGMSADIPPQGPYPVRTMADMGMGSMDGMGDTPASGSMAGMDAPAPADGMKGMEMPAPGASAPPDAMPGMGAAKPMAPGAANDMAGMAGMPGMSAQAASPAGKTQDHAGMNMAAAASASGITVSPDADGMRRLKYQHLRALDPNKDKRPPQREILVRLTGDMNRYFWTINDKKFSDSVPFKVQLGERFRIKFVNTTMMEHPMHLHGVFMELVNGNGEYAPRKHTIIVSPAQTVELDATYEDNGVWAFHCHLFYHAATGMFQLMEVA